MNYRFYVVKVYTKNDIEWDFGIVGANSIRPFGHTTGEYYSPLLKQSLMRNQSNGNNRQSQTNFIEI